MQHPHSVYSTWGYHDELGDQVRLTEDLVMKALDGLERWREAGVTQDYFHIDCFWFDPKGGYLEFHPDTWPNGFDSALKRILDAGMTPGLWYSTTGLHMDTDAWADSRSEDGRRYSLAEGPYADKLEEALLFAAREWKVRLYKFDFADFFTTAAGSTLSPEEHYRLSQSRFLQILRRLKSEYPDARIITHCGFWRRPFSVASGSPMRYGPDRSLFAGVDRIFSGDPHMTNVPQMTVPHNADLFQDRNVWKMMQEGFPVHRVEDHGVIIGTTNTCHYRGREGFSRTHIGQLARGGRRDFYYGDPALLTDDDLERMKRARAVFFEAFDRGLATSYVGPGEPGVAPWHGYVTGEGHTGLAYLVNTTLDPVTAVIDLTNLTAAAVLFHDGVHPPSVQTQPDVLTVRLGPEQMALVGLGEFAERRWDIGSDLAAVEAVEARPAPLAFHRSGDALVAECSEGPPSGMNLLIRAEALDTPEYSVQSSEPFVFAKQSTKQVRDFTPHAHRDLEITVTNDGRRLEPVFQVPNVPIWSGTSWVARTFDPSGPFSVSIRQNWEERKRVVARAYWVRQKVRS